MSAVLVRVTQCFYGFFSRDVAFITGQVKRQAEHLGRFSRSRHFILPNCFDAFGHDASIVATPVGDESYVFLCSGAVITKDLRGALRHYRNSDLLLGQTLVILGLGKMDQACLHMCDEMGIDRSRVRVLGSISQTELIAYYKGAALVWVHSLHEGFGRNIAEAGMCGRSVLASNIPPFRKQAEDNDNIFLYDNHNDIDFGYQARQCLHHVFRQPAISKARHVLLSNLEVILN